VKKGSGCASVEKTCLAIVRVGSRVIAGGPSEWVSSLDSWASSQIVVERGMLVGMVRKSRVEDVSLWAGWRLVVVRYPG
jgi:hypothetical protein